MSVGAFPHIAHRILDTSAIIEAIPKKQTHDFIP